LHEIWHEQEPCPSATPSLHTCSAARSVGHLGCGSAGGPARFALWSAFLVSAHAHHPKCQHRAAAPRHGKHARRRPGPDVARAEHSRGARVLVAGAPQRRQQMSQCCSEPGTCSLLRAHVAARVQDRYTIQFISSELQSVVIVESVDTAVSNASPNRIPQCSMWYHVFVLVSWYHVFVMVSCFCTGIMVSCFCHGIMFLYWYHGIMFLYWYHGIMFLYCVTTRTDYLRVSRSVSLHLQYARTVCADEAATFALAPAP
jgi:hypothetical protein